ncbi:hypothetical protein [Cryptosporangium japonicum]|uniref:Transposase n=1 Tax=Cryptosporangium japonicum TaxID=80872 RepID=A0ABP3DNV1_9ACTN
MVFLSHYVGRPAGAELNTLVEQLITDHRGRTTRALAERRRRRLNTVAVNFAAGHRLNFVAGHRLNFVAGHRLNFVAGRWLNTAAAG